MSAVGLYTAKDWPPMTALFPRLIAFPMLAVVIAIFVLELIMGRRQDNDGEADDDVEFNTTTLRMIRYFTWLIGFVVLIWAIGIEYTIPIYIFSYMKIEGKYGWLKCGVYAVTTTVFISLLFEYAFRVAWPEGALLRALNL